MCRLPWLLTGEDCTYSNTGGQVSSLYCMIPGTGYSIPVHMVLDYGPVCLLHMEGCAIQYTVLCVLASMLRNVRAVADSIVNGSFLSTSMLIVAAFVQGLCSQCKVLHKQFR